MDEASNLARRASTIEVECAVNLLEKVHCHRNPGTHAPSRSNRTKLAMGENETRAGRVADTHGEHEGGGAFAQTLGQPLRRGADGEPLD
ncbi:MAG: hypothetical protein ACHP84_03155 [Caulobacterales bacterium]